jgi:hypothetical protein
MGLVRGFIAFESVECIPDDGLDVSDLSVSISLAFPSLVGKRPVILANEEKQVVSNAIRHFDSVHDLRHGGANSRFSCGRSYSTVLLTQAYRNSASSVQSKYRYRSAVSFTTSTFLSGAGRQSINPISGPVAGFTALLLQRRMQPLRTRHKHHHR